MKQLYFLTIKIFDFLIWISSFFNQKAKLLLEGRKKTFDYLKKQNLNNVIWFHVSSLGEFEQARPLIEKIKKELSEFQILLTFFSPSGYEIRKNYKYADFITYLPSDTPKNAKNFLDIVNPKFVFWVKYDFWYFFLKEIKNRQINSILFSAVFRENQFFFKKTNKWFLKAFEVFDIIFVQDEKSKKILEKKGFSNVEIAGDTRIDRVLQIANENKEFPIIEKFTKEQFAVIAGSSWEKDETLLSELAKDFPKIKFIIAPHDISQKHIKEIQKKFPNHILYSQSSTAENLSKYQTLIIDNIGLLAFLYKYGKIAYIGGGFGKGIHNILEPAVYGMPIIFGPNYKKFKEANDLIALKGAFCIKNYFDLKQIFSTFITNYDFWKKTSLIVKNYIDQNKGATDKIFQKTLSLLKKRI